MQYKGVADLQTITMTMTRGKVKDVLSKADHKYSFFCFIKKKGAFFLCFLMKANHEYLPKENE